MAYEYTWALEAPVWTADADFRLGAKWMPQLVLSRSGSADAAGRGLEHKRRLLSIAFVVDAETGAQPRWVVQDYTDQSYRPDIGEDGKMSSKPGRAYTQHPRTSLRAAIDCASEILAAHAVPHDVTAIGKVAVILEPATAQLTAALNKRLQSSRA